jgi:hypothetical protein
MKVIQDLEILEAILKIGREILLQFVVLRASFFKIWRLRILSRPPRAYPSWKRQPRLDAYRYRNLHLIASRCSLTWTISHALTRPNPELLEHVAA